MKYLLIAVIFTGPTSADKIKYSWHNSLIECQNAAFKIDGNTVCIPFEN